MDRKEAAKFLPCVKARYTVTISLIVLTLVFYIVTLVILVLDRIVGKGGLSPLLAFVLRISFVPMVMVAVVEVLVHIRRIVRLRRAAMRADFKLCPKCGYELSAAAAAPEGLARCPECGEMVKVPAAAGWWRAWVRGTEGGVDGEFC